MMGVYDSGCCKDHKSQVHIHVLLLQESHLQQIILKIQICHQPIPVTCTYYGTHYTGSVACKFQPKFRQFIQYVQMW